MKTLKFVCLLLPTLFVSLFLSIAINAQTTAFTYQGRFTDSTVPQPTNGTYDFEFALYDANTGGTQQGAAQTVTGVNVSSGVFTVQLDFTAVPFAAGANRYLEIRVKKPTDPAFVALLPRQPLTSVPYSIQSLNATQLGGVAASNYLQTNGNGSQLTNVSVDAANLTGVVPIGKGGTGSATQNFVDLTTTQTVAGGKTFSSAVNTTTQYNIGGSRVLSTAGSNNLFAGVAAGQSNTTGGSNSFVGANAGQSNTTGVANSFVGGNAGVSNTTGSQNSFVGVSAGFYNTTGFKNSFVGVGAGLLNTTGNFNTAIGYGAYVNVGNLQNATAIGYDAIVNASNKVRIGNTAVTVIEGQVAYTFSSDKNLKENFLAVNGKDVLRKIRGFNLTSWNYIGQDAKAFRHYGPMAQDFYAAFGEDKFGTSGSPTAINSGDMSGVMLAAIKELSTENEAQQAQIKRQQIVIDGLKKIVCAGNPTADICTEKQNEK